MKFQVQEATPADLDAAKHIYGPEKGDLSAAAIEAMWPISHPNDLESARLRAEWSCQQQKDILKTDTTTRFVKVVDIDNNNDIIAFGRWHRYPNGSEQVADVEAVGLKDRNDPATWPTGLMKDLYLGLIDELFGARDSWIGKQHCWILTNIKTREPFQKKGVGSLILQWGLAEAAKEGVPAYLEAVSTAKHLYETHGFREVGMQKVDGTPYGFPEVQLELSRMRADPK